MNTNKRRDKMTKDELKRRIDKMTKDDLKSLINEVLKKCSKINKFDKQTNIDDLEVKVGKIGNFYDDIYGNDSSGNDSSYKSKIDSFMEEFGKKNLQ